MKVLWRPNDGAQTSFMSSLADEVLYGGAAGGGKSDALIMLPLSRIHQPLHRSVYFRRERKRLQEAIDRARRMYSTVDPMGQWHETELRYKWSTGAMTQFASAEQEKDIEAFKSFEYDLILFDELTEFSEWQYKFMFMRARSKVEGMLALIRNGTNPGGPGMDWVDQRFIGWREDGSQQYSPYTVYKHTVHIDGIGERTRTRQYIPATVLDNPQLPNRDAYMASLADLPEDEREAYLYGRWGRWKGAFFKRMPKYTAPEFKDTDWYVIRCMDYGFNDPACVLWLVVYPKKRLVEVVAEIYGEGMTTDVIAHRIKAVEDELRIKGRVSSSVISPDAIERKTSEGGPSIARMFTEHGLWWSKANDNRVIGWAQIRRLIARGQLQVWTGRAPNLMRTLPKLPYKPGKPDDIKDRGVEDHAAEALRYGLMAYHDQGSELEKVLTPLEQESKRDRTDPWFDSLMASIERQQTEGLFLPGLGPGW